MKILSLTKNRIEELEKEYVKIMDEYEKYKNITVDELWKNEINEFLEAYDKFLTGLSELDKKNEKHKK
jgi:hypothetical protein